MREKFERVNRFQHRGGTAGTIKTLADTLNLGSSTLLRSRLNSAVLPPLDSDNDGLSNLAESTNSIAQTSITNSNGVAVHTTNPLVADTDGDGNSIRPARVFKSFPLALCG